MGTCSCILGGHCNFMNEVNFCSPVVVLLCYFCFLLSSRTVVERVLDYTILEIASVLAQRFSRTEYSRRSTRASLLQQLVAIILHGEVAS